MLRLFFAVVCAGFKPALAIPPPVDVDAPKYDELESLTVTKPLDATRQSGWKSAHDKIFLPGGPGKEKPHSIFVWE